MLKVLETNAVFCSLLGALEQNGIKLLIFFSYLELWKDFILTKHALIS